jgi:hypothetical protein
MADAQPARFAIAKWAIREIVAATVWIYLLLKLFVFDLDLYVVTHLAPRLRWAADYKAFVILAVVAASWLAMGNATFFKTALYIGGYPAVLLFWRLPKAAFKTWPAVIISTPVIYRLATTFRATFLLYTMAILSGLAAILSTNPAVLGLAAIAMTSFILVHLLRSFRKAYGTGAFARLAGLLSKLRAHVEKGSFDGPKLQAPGGTEPPTPAAGQPVLPMLYLLAGVYKISANFGANHSWGRLCT